MQVVELPKEKPENALQLFADVPGLQILVMGGDGTAGWILGCLDQIQEARAALPEAQTWAPPPVAVIPMGTGKRRFTCLPSSRASCVIHKSWVQFQMLLSLTSEHSSRI